MLRLSTGSPVMYDQTLRGLLCELPSMIVFDKAESQIHPRRHTGRSPNRSVANKDPIDLDPRFRKAALKLICKSPMCRGAALLQKACVPQDKGAKSD
jgi:hypothetical protein